MNWVKNEKKVSRLFSRRQKDILGGKNAVGKGEEMRKCGMCLKEGWPILFGLDHEHKMICAVCGWKYMSGPELNLESNKEPLKVRCA